MISAVGNLDVKLSQKVVIQHLFVKISQLPAKRITERHWKNLIGSLAQEHTYSLIDSDHKSITINQ